MSDSDSDKWYYITLSIMFIVLSLPFIVEAWKKNCANTETLREMVREEVRRYNTLESFRVRQGET